MERARREADGDDRRKLETLLRIAHALALEVQLQPLLKLMVGEVATAMQAERSTLFLVDAQQPQMLLSRVSAPVEQEIRVPFGTGIAGATAATRKAINLADAYADPRFNPAYDRASGFRTRSLLSAPILDQSGELVGVVQALNRRGGAFTAGDEQFLAAIGVHLAMALQRAAAVDALLGAQALKQSLEVAREIQAGLLPHALPALAETGGADISAALMPVYEVGGDLYDFFQLDEHRLCFMIGDVSGKGIPAALFMAMTRTAFKMAAQAAPEALGNALGQVNRFLCANNARSMFVTALAGVLDLRTGAVTYADAGHEPPLIVTAGGAAERVEKVGGMVLGLMPEEEYAIAGLRLGAGETLVLYTDGVTEAMREDGGFFGVEAAAQALSQAGPGANSQALVDALLARLQQFVGGCRASDDVTVLAIQYRGPSLPSTQGSEPQPAGAARHAGRGGGWRAK
ncbi:MAG TPA: SpoIIE family protein phosphatase [Terriglobales bacterium]|nr:SpoIIE family protein phosphatase [Terriglobales bacterium]